jgi:hypothetical protein
VTCDTLHQFSLSKLNHTWMVQNIFRSYLPSKNPIYYKKYLEAKDLESYNDHKLVQFWPPQEQS